MRAWAWLLPLWCAAVFAAPGDDAYRGADSILLAQVREGFKQAPESAQATRELMAVLDGALPVDSAVWPPVFRAYRAALEALAGKYSHAPWAKYRHVKSGLARFAGLVEAYPDSIEVRMLRYATCRPLPDFFGVRPQADADLAALVELFGQAPDPMVPAAQRRGYVQWIVDHGQPAPELRARLEKLLDP